jgi:ribosomal protein S18 acetylase RimI-like enzyme
MKPPLIRPAAPEDAPAILELWRLAGAFPTVSDNEQSIRLLIAHDPQSLLVAEQDGELVGSLIAAFDGWRGVLSRLAVLPIHRRRGVASALIDAGERSLRERGAIRINTFAIRAETGALAFWDAVGYECDERVTRFAKNL